MLSTGGTIHFEVWLDLRVLFLAFHANILQVNIIEKHTVTRRKVFIIFDRRSIDMSSSKVDSMRKWHRQIKVGDFHTIKNVLFPRNWNTVMLFIIIKAIVLHEFPSFFLRSVNSNGMLRHVKSIWKSINDKNFESSSRQAINRTFENPTD